jgi:hypothetical protein
MTAANNVDEMERHPSVCLLSGAPTKLQRLEMRLDASRCHVTNPGMTGLQTSETQTLFQSN